MPGRHEARDASELPAPPSSPMGDAAAAPLAKVATASYWRALCPALHCEDAAYESSTAPLELAEKTLSGAKARLLDEGFTHVSAAKLRWSTQPAACAAAVETLKAAGWPSPFLLVFDELWAIQRQAAPLLAAASGGNVPCGDTLVWHVAPSEGDAGFSPHRDRQPHDAPGSFRGDGTPKYATAWVALTDASPDNSCLYFIPRDADPGYSAGDDCAAVATLGGGDALRACLPTTEAMQRIRAVPAAAGSAVLFSHRTFHWGSAGRRGCTAPRIAMSFGAACPSFEAPYLTGAQGTARGVAGAGVPFPRLVARLALAAAQCIAYADRFAPLPPAMLRRLRALTEADGGAHLAPAYARRIASEFVAAAKASAAAFGSSKGGAVADTSESEEEGALMDEALDAMLDAEAAGFGADFDDDFDDGPEGADVAPVDEEEEGEEDGEGGSGSDDSDGAEDAPLSEAFWAAAAARFRAARAAGVGGKASAAEEDDWEAALGDDDGAEIGRAGAAPRSGGAVPKPQSKKARKA